MTTINLKDFYAWYTHDEYIEVPDEVAEELKADKRYEAAYRRRVTRNKAQYSLDCDDGIEYSACLHEPSPEELVMRSERFFYLWNALNTLPEMQGRRVEACVIDGKSYAEMGRAEGVHSGSVRGSVGNEFVKMIFANFLNSNSYLLKNLPTSRVCIFLEIPYSKASLLFPIASH